MWLSSLALTGNVPAYVAGTTSPNTNAIVVELGRPVEAVGSRPAITLDATIQQPDRAVCLIGYCRIVGDDDEGLTPSTSPTRKRETG